MRFYLRYFADAFLTTFLTAFATGASPAGWQPTLPGPQEPPRAPEGWRAPQGAVNPITGAVCR
jgi:hypothetical protein